MPPADRIVAHWAALDPPWLKSWFIGWGEPFCFACGWLPPVRKGWPSSTRWLDRAHLHDRIFGGPDEPGNLAMLCHLCLYDAPDFHSTQAGIEWVRRHS